MRGLPNEVRGPVMALNPPRRATTSGPRRTGVGVAIHRRNGALSGAGRLGLACFACPAGLRPHIVNGYAMLGHQRQDANLCVSRFLSESFSRFELQVRNFFEKFFVSRHGRAPFSEIEKSSIACKRNTFPRGYPRSIKHMPFTVQKNWPVPQFLARKSG
jgi:hypothetical protein